MSAGRDGGRDGGTEARVRASIRVRMAIQRAAVEEFGAVESHEPVEGYQFLTRAVLDDPLLGVRAALVAHRAAWGQVREYAEQARGAGRTWDDVAAALDVAVGPDDARTAGEVAFGWLYEGEAPDAGRDRGWSRPQPTARWTCTACGGRVTDRGPYESHPDDDESGHRPGCPRHTAAVQEFRRDMEEL